ncbi:hypothetical protein D3C87_1426760 [compost metagenome]
MLSRMLTSLSSTSKRRPGSGLPVPGCGTAWLTGNGTSSDSGTSMLNIEPRPGSEYTSIL